MLPSSAVEWCASWCQMSDQIASDSVGDGYPPSRSRSSAKAASSRAYTVDRDGRPRVTSTSGRLDYSEQQRIDLIKFWLLDHLDNYRIELIK